MSQELLTSIQEDVKSSLKSGNKFKASTLRLIVSAIKLEEKNVVLINNKPKIGAEGYKIVFIHPKSTGGVLVELAEKPK